MKIRSYGVYLKSPYKLLESLSEKRRLDWISDITFLKLLYRAKFHRKLNLKNPQTLNEKIHWLKLYNRDPLYTRLADKLTARAYIAEKIGAQYSAPILGIWNSFDEIDFNRLPEQFVLKCNHDSCSYVICTDKTHFDFKIAKERLERCMNRNYYWMSREWAYRDIKPMLLAEQFLIGKCGESMVDYKFLCFNGEPKCCKVCAERQSAAGVKIDFYDLQWNHLPFIEKYPNISKPVERPEALDEMIRLCRILARPFPFVRIDLYLLGTQIYFSEFTFYPGAGMEEFIPDEWDYILGSWLQLPDKRAPGDLSNAGTAV